MHWPSGSAEMIRTAADLVRAAGAGFRFGALLRAEDPVDSSAVEGFAGPASGQRPEGYD